MSSFRKNVAAARASLATDLYWWGVYQQRLRARRRRWWLIFAIVGAVVALFSLLVEPSGYGLLVGLVAGAVIGPLVANWFAPARVVIAAETFQEQAAARLQEKTQELSELIDRRRSDQDTTS